jgi:Flp pilus assembly protein TadD
MLSAMKRSRHALALAIVLLATCAAFLPVLRSDFLNWDDPDVLVNNPDLGGPHVLRWAFTTTLVGHYQPLAWLVWSAIKSRFGLEASAFHASSLIVHVLNVALVYVVTWRLTSLAALEPRYRLIAAVVASMTFAVHPVRVEAVAWASAFPYELSLALLLVAFLAYVKYGESQKSTIANKSAIRNPQSAMSLTLSISSYVASLLARASGVGFPLVLLLVDVYPLRRRAGAGRLLLEKLPYLAAAVAAAFVESRARELATLEDVSLGARLTMAAAAPFAYLGRTLWPVRLTPLDALPIAPALEWVPLMLATIAFATISVITWRLRRQWPALGIAWVAYIVLLAPAAGLTPSGLQATADRYMYVPGVIVSILLGVAAARVRGSTRSLAAAAILTLAVTAALGILTWRQTRWWRDSITLWTRAADLDPRNDVATYNLAIALAAAGREAEAMTRYEQTLRLVPDHTLARRALTGMQAAQAEREGGRLADAGRLDAANAQYTRALELDSTRLHARAARGMVLLQLGRTADAAAELRTAHDAGVDDAAVLNGLAFVLMETGRPAEAVTVLKQGVARHPDDVNLAHNLARLLATADDPGVRDGAAALRLALDVRDRTGGRDPRVLDTLAAAYAATGRRDLARETAQQAIVRARELGDSDLANEIARHLRDLELRTKN